MTKEDLEKKLKRALAAEDSRFVRSDVTSALNSAGLYSFDIKDISVEQAFRGVKADVVWSEGGQVDLVEVFIEC